MDRLFSGSRSTCAFFTPALLLFLTLSGLTTAPAAAQTPEPQQVAPVSNQTEPDPNNSFTGPSIRIELPIGQRVDFGTDFEVALTPYAIQRLTERTYFVVTNLYASTVFVGDRGVLVIDCAGHGGPGEVQALLDAVAQLTPLPITHLVLSHPHTDHVGNSLALQQRIPGLEVIGSRWLVEQLDLYGYPIARPTHVVKKRHDRFRFETWTFRMVTPVPVAHTPADSYVVTPDRVLHAVDFVHADRLSFIESSVVQNLDGFILFLRHLAGEAGNYDFFNPGHLNVAYQSDVDRALGYYRALYRSWWEVLQEVDVTQFVSPYENNAAVWLRNFFDAVAERLFYEVAPEYGHLRFFEVARDHASKVHENMFLHRLNASDPSSFGRIPSFDPIPPQ
jgi:glyoxylase-like metal-dependent hydrolase (beta-lactamase superfamily II)